MAKQLTVQEPEMAIAETETQIATTQKHEADESAIAPSMNTVIMLPDGRVAVLNPPTAGSDYLKFLQIAAKDNMGAIKELMMKAFLVNGEPLTIDMLEDEPPSGIGFDGIAALSSETTRLIRIVENEESTEDEIILPGGQVATRKKLPGNDYFQWQQMVVGKGTGKAMAWVLTRMFLIDGQPLTDGQINNPAPEGLGFEAIAILCNQVTKLFTVPQTPKT